MTATQLIAVLIAPGCALIVLGALHLVRMLSTPPEFGRVGPAKKRQPETTLTATWEMVLQHAESQRHFHEAVSEIVKQIGNPPKQGTSLSTPGPTVKPTVRNKPITHG